MSAHTSVITLLNGVYIPELALSLLQDEDLLSAVETGKLIC